MPSSNVEPNFSFVLKDLQSCTGNKQDARYISNRFKELIRSIQDNDIFKLNFGDFTGYVARNWNQGSKEYRNYLWLGFAHNRYKRPQDEVQFQVSIHRNALYIELFIDQAAVEARKKVTPNVAKNLDGFLSLLRELPDCSIGYTGNDEFEKACKEIKKEDLIKIVQHIPASHTHFFISKRLSISRSERFADQIIPEILFTWLKYLPLCDILENRESSRIYASSGSRINNELSIKRNIRKRFSSQKIDFNETKAKASERESTQIIYEANWQAQEKANSEHRKTVMLIADHLTKKGITPFENVIDVFAEKNKRIFIFEIKSIHLNNFIHQTRTAIGQLLDVNNHYL